METLEKPRLNLSLPHTHFYPFMNIFPQSSFFRENRAPSLPTPDEIRALHKRIYPFAKKDDYPSPVIIPSLGLFVKYGPAVTLTEVQTQVAIREQFQDEVPTPEVFGWAQHGGQGFIYMALVNGVPLHERWKGLSEEERLGVCAQVRKMVGAWRSLVQDEDDPYIGSIGKQPLSSFLMRDLRRIAGPYTGSDAVQKFHHVCGIEITQNVPIVFTHNDLSASNIIVSRGPNPKVVSIVDWDQAGWLPSYWECCKARRVTVPEIDAFDLLLEDEWRMKYVPLIVDLVDDDEFYQPWLWFEISVHI